MGHNYQAVQWNRQKKIYDLILVSGVGLYLGLFVIGGAVAFPNTTIPTLIIRAFGTGAFLLLHIILCIGPLCRLNTRFLPLLYNRRHMGVTMFLLALVHGGFSLIFFHTTGDVSPLESLFLGNRQYDSISSFPFQPLGLIALFILFMMAATSHDFWLANLTPPIWKSLHMLVYVAYGLIVAHVSLGILQSETDIIYAVLLGGGMLLTLALHLIAGLREKPLDSSMPPKASDDYVFVCKISDIEENCAHITNIGGERVAVFKYDGKISAVSNVCQHQNGPLGEGKIIDGLITCPWHGFQYCPHNGASPEPFTEKIPTFKVRVSGEKIYVHSQPNLPGTEVAPALIQAEEK